MIVSIGGLDMHLHGAFGWWCSFESDMHGLGMGLVWHPASLMGQKFEKDNIKHRYAKENVYDIRAS